MARDRFVRVLRARRVMTARAANERWSEPLIEPDEQESESAHRVPYAESTRIGANAPAAASTRSTSLASSWCGAVSTPRIATNIRR